MRASAQCAIALKNMQRVRCLPTQQTTSGSSSFCQRFPVLFRRFLGQIEAAHPYPANLQFFVTPLGLLVPQSPKSFMSAVLTPSPQLNFLPPPVLSLLSYSYVNPSRGTPPDLPTDDAAAVLASLLEPPRLTREASSCATDFAITFSEFLEL